MANLKSSKKAIRVSERKKAVNDTRKTLIKKEVKSLKLATDKSSKMAAMSKVQSQLDKAVKTKVLSKNKANRMKSRLVAASK